MHAAGGQPRVAPVSTANMASLPLQTMKAQPSMRMLPVAHAKKFAPKYSPNQFGFMDRAKKFVSEVIQPVAAPKVETSSTGFSPDQLEFLKRRQQETGKVWTAPGSSSGGSSKSSKGYQPRYQPRYQGRFR